MAKATKAMGREARNADRWRQMSELYHTHGDARGRAACVVVTRWTVIFLSSKKHFHSFIFRSSFIDAAREGERATDASPSSPSRRSLWVPIAAAVAAPAGEDTNRDKKT